MSFYQALKPFLFGLPVEEAHDLSLWFMQTFPHSVDWLAPTPLRCDELGRLCPYDLKKPSVLPWQTPMGIAAGLDKNAQTLLFMHRLQVSSIECGTVTLHPQSGNPKPRLWRYPELMSLRNAMGFPNLGCEAVQARVEEFQNHTQYSLSIGMNLGKSKNATPTQALEEYEQLYSRFFPQVDWLVINVSSPNTQGLRDLQNQDWMNELLRRLESIAQTKKNQQRLSPGLFIKLSPDMDEAAFSSLTRFLLSHSFVSGLVVSNTTIKSDWGPGGVSGAELTQKARLARQLAIEVQREVAPEKIIIGVGGFMSFEDVLDFWWDGGCYFQIYTSFIYRGAEIIQEWYKEMLDFLDTVKITSLADFFSLPLVERQRKIELYWDSKI